VSAEEAEAPLSVMVRFAVGRSIGVMGRQMLSVAVGYELYERTRSPLTLGLVGLVQVIPVFALFVPGGILADRYDRRKLSAISSTGAAVACGLLAVASFIIFNLY
jgi:MFS family permease